MNSATTAWRAQIAWGVLLAIAAGWAVSVDVQNNYEYGRNISEQAARGLVLAALLVAILPGAASFHRWTPIMRGATGICLGLTIWAAAMNYGNGGGAIISAAMLAKHDYTSAKADETRARQTLASIKEEGQVDELAALLKKASEATKKAKEEQVKQCKFYWMDDCTKAKEAEAKVEAAETALMSRLSAAKSRDKADVDLKVATSKLAELGAKPDAGKGVEANMVTTLIAKQLGADDSSVMRWAIFAVEAALIVAMQAAALLFGYAVELIGDGWKARPRREQKPGKAKKPVPAGKPTGGTQAPLPANVVPLDAHRHSVKAWLDGATVAGGMLRGGEALKAYKRFAGRMAKDVTGAELRSIMEALLPGAVEPRNSGFVVRGLQLRTAPAAFQSAVM